MQQRILGSKWLAQGRHYYKIPPSTEEETGSPLVMYDGTSPVLHYCKVYKGFIYIDYAVHQYISELYAATKENHKGSLGCKKLIVLPWPRCLTPISLNFLD